MCIPGTGEPLAVAQTQTLLQLCRARSDRTARLSRDITDDEAFVDELRVTLRFFAAVLVRRTQKVTNDTWCLLCLPLSFVNMV